MLLKEVLEIFKKQYKEEHGKDLSDNEALAIALFENAILHTQNFVSRLEQEFGKLGHDKRGELSEDIMSYSLSLILIYLGLEIKFDSLRLMVLNEYEKFIINNSGTMNEEQNKALHQLLYEKLSRNIMWLSTTFEKGFVIDKIVSGVSSYVPSYKYKSIIERLVSEIDVSMKHFGIIPK